MYALNVRNVNHALPRGLDLLRSRGLKVSPRGQETLEYPGPVATTYDRPDEMVLFDRRRDANPFFHFFEALWILAGRQDVAFLAHFNKKMAEYSDDTRTFHAPYGHRLRTALVGSHGYIDQIETCIEILKKDPDSRQAVMSIWDPQQDLDPRIFTKDRPCNDMVFLKVRDGALRMTVCIRSNDIVWGAYGANAVQFGTLLKYMAGRIGVRVGTLTQVSDSYHVYTNLPFWQQWCEATPVGLVPMVDDPYLRVYGDAVRSPSHYMNSEDLELGMFDEDLTRFFSDWDVYGEVTVTGLCSRSFRNTVIPMYATHHNWKNGYVDAALETAAAIEADDWRMAAQNWMRTRLERKAAVV